jgi:branched-chain amino acid transport system substrate-binding protein
LIASAATIPLIGVAGRASAAKDPVRVGIPTPLTGTYGDVGNQAKRAVEFAVNEANAAGGVDGREVQVRFLDTEAKPDLARQQAEKLALTGHNLLAATQTSAESLAIAPMLMRWNALYICTIAKANAITGASCSPRAFRVNHPDASDAATVLPWLKTRTETKWAIMSADYAWGHSAGGSFRKAAESIGKTIVSENYAPLGASDYAPYIQRIKDSGAAGMWVALSGGDAINFGRQAHQFGLLDHIVTAGVSFTTDNTVKAMGDFSKGIWAIVNYSSTLDTPANKAFVAAWARRYPGSAPTNFEGETYVGMQVLFQAVSKAGSVAPADLAKAMPGMMFDTVYGRNLMRPEDHQLVVPNYFGRVGERDGVLKPVIEMVVPPDQAVPPPDGSCKLTS